MKKLRKSALLVIVTMMLTLGAKAQSNYEIGIGAGTSKFGYMAELDFSKDTWLDYNIQQVSSIVVDFYENQNLEVGFRLKFNIGEKRSYFRPGLGMEVAAGRYARNWRQASEEIKNKHSHALGCRVSMVLEPVKVDVRRFTFALIGRIGVATWTSCGLGPEVEGYTEGLYTSLMARIGFKF